jgi:hypothetical protein
MNDLLDVDKTVYPPEFETFWKWYPRRIGGNPKNLAFRAWRKAIKVVTPERLRCSLSAYFNDLGDKRNTEYVLMAATYLNQRRYEQYLPDEGINDEGDSPKEVFERPTNARKLDLLNAIGESNYRLWCDDCEIVGDKLILKNEMKRDWVKNRFGKEIYKLALRI